MPSDELSKLATPAARIFHWLKRADEVRTDRGNRPALITWLDVLGVEDTSEGYAAVFGCGASLMGQTVEVRELADQLPSTVYPTTILMQNFDAVEATVKNFASVANLNSEQFMKPMREVVWSELANLAFAFHVAFAEPSIDNAKRHSLVEQAGDLMDEVRGETTLSATERATILWHLREVARALRQTPLEGTRPVARAVDASIGMIARGGGGPLTWLMESENGKRLREFIATAASLVAIYVGADTLLADHAGETVIQLDQAPVEPPRITVNVPVESRSRGAVEHKQLPASPELSEVVEGEIVDDPALPGGDN